MLARKQPAAAADAAQAGKTGDILIDPGTLRELAAVLEECIAALGAAKAKPGTAATVAAVEAASGRAAAARMALLGEGPLGASQCKPLESKRADEGKSKPAAFINRIFRRGKDDKEKARVQFHRADLAPPAPPAQAQTTGRGGVRPAPVQVMSGSANDVAATMTSRPQLRPPSDTRQAQTPRARKPHQCEDDLVKEVKIERVESCWVGGGGKGNCGCRRAQVSGHVCQPFCENIGCDGTCQDDSREGSEASEGGG
eukprot:TRINITY_DN25113_c0_g1_i1.p1 TRINITY_DN25113_c0_g1~~TRINITY_DN25113_c0_g1_i1.p1  ORF type:complete len:284 (+),score=61.18 TRINITY_DN25113_c0_g1_i1:90-854(+)